MTREECLDPGFAKGTVPATEAEPSAAASGANDASVEVPGGRGPTVGAEPAAPGPLDRTTTPAVSLAADWREVLDRLGRIEAAQFDLHNAIWEELFRRLDRIERNQSELAEALARIREAPPRPGDLSPGHSFAFGSPIEPLDRPWRPGPAQPDMGLPPFARSFPQVPQGSAPPGAGEELPDGSDAASSPSARHAADEGPKGPEQRPDPWEVSGTAPGPAPAIPEPSWVTVPLPEVTEMPKASTRRRWLFGRRSRDHYRAAAPLLAWQPRLSPPAGSDTPSAPPGFVSPAQEAQGHATAATDQPGT